MVHRPADSRLLSNLLQQEKDYLKQFNLLFNAAAASLDSVTAYAAASPPPASQVILAVAGFLTAADDALKRYALGVERWRDSMRLLKDMEDDVGNIMRDREILVTRLIKVSKSHKSNSGSGTFRELIGERLNSSSSLSLNHDSSSSPSPSRPVSVSFPTSTKLGAAQSELQGCETQLASKESELALKRCAAVREGLTIRAKAMIDCSRTWGQLGRQILHSLDDLGIAEDPRDEHPPSDFSSICPSQSASQIGQEAVPITGHPTDPTFPRPHSVSSTAPSSLYYTPVTPATYKTETVTYAPAISLVVPASLPSSPMGSDINTPLALGPPLDVDSLGAPAALALSPYAQDTEVHTKMRIPAAHAINEYDIPTAEVEKGTGAETRRHSRGESLGRHPQRTSLASEPTSGPNAIMSNMSSSSSTLNHQRHTLERRITEEDLAGNNPMTTGNGSGAAPTRVVGSALIEVFDSPANDEEEDEDDLPVEVNQLIKQGKLAVVENPRFMRRKELEREQMKLADQQHESELEPEKKKFPFLHQHPKRTGTQDRSDTGPVPFAQTISAVPSTPNSKKSPSKRFFGSLRGLFGARQPASPQVPSQVQDSSPSRIRSVDSDVDPEDDPGDESLTKTGGGFQALLRSASAKKKVGSGGGGGGGTRWSTRTEKNIHKLTRSGDDDDDYDTYLSQNVGKGAAGDVVAKAGLAGSVITGARGVRKRSASDIGTTPVAASGSTVAGGRNKLRKTLAPPTAAVLHPQEDTSSGVAVREHPSTLMRKNIQPAAPERRRASVDQSAGRTSVVQQGAVGQPPVGGGGGKEVIVDLGKRRRTISDTAPVTNIPARGIPAATRPSAAAIPAVSKGYSSDTATAGSGQATLSKRKSIVKNADPGPTAPSIPAAIPKVPAATATPSKSTLTRQTSAGKTQTGTTPNIPVDNVNIKAGGSRHPQPHRQHSASSSAIVLPAGGTNPSGTLISHPGWDAQALPTGGGLSRNNSIGSGVSGAAGGSSGGAGGMSKTKKQKQTVLGQGMGSGASVARRSSLGSSSGHGGGPVGSVVQPTQPAQSLMSIVEDVAKHNRDWSQESSQILKNRNKVMSVLAKDKTGPVGMVDVVKAPPRVGRDELAQLDSAMIKARVTETSSMNLAPAPAPGAVSSAGGGGSGGGGRLVDIKAPGSVFDERKATHLSSAPAVHQQASSSTTQNQQANVIQRLSVTTGPAATSTPARGSRRPAKSPLRSALKNPSRTPSPLPSPFFGSHLQNQQQAVQEGSNVDVVAPQPSFLFGPQRSSQTQSTTASDIRPTTMANGRPASHDPASRRRKGKRQIKSASDQVVGELDDSTSTNDTGDEIFYTDDEDDHPVSTGNMPMLNGHAVGSSDLSHSTTSTAVVHRLPPTATSSASQLTTTSAPRRRKSVRVSLQPTFSPPPPAIDDDEEEQKYLAWKQHHHGGGQQHLHVHAPVPVAGGSSTLLNRQKTVAPDPSAPVYDIWQNSSDEDAEYQNAKRLLKRAAKKENDMKVFAAGSR